MKKKKQRNKKSKQELTFMSQLLFEERSNQEERDLQVLEKVEEIELCKIGEFPNHPFKIRNDDKMQEMVKSIKKYGVLLPIIVRTRGEGNYQMISGHRRKKHIYQENIAENL